MWGSTVHVGCESNSAQSKFNLQDRNCYINLNLVQHYSPQATALVTTTKCFHGGAAQGYFHLATTRRKLKKDAQTWEIGKCPPP